MKKIVILIYCVIIGCSSGNNNIEQTNIESPKEDIIYTVDSENIKVIWAGYKTTSKVKVVGLFEEFFFNKEGQEFESINNLLDGLEFEVFINSSNSGDPIRDLNLKNNFFKLLAKEFSIKGNFRQIEKDSLTSFFSHLPENQNLKLGYTYQNEILEIKGRVNLVNQFGGQKAFENIHKLCYELHKGDDGISKTWEEIEIHIKVPIITKIGE